MKNKTSSRNTALEQVYDLGKLQNASIMVVGAGALGNEVLKNLALLGLKDLFIVDFDRVEEGNLSRSVLFQESDCGRLKAEVAAQRLLEINPEIKPRYLIGDIACDVGLGLIQRMDAIIACVDNRLARLWLNRHAFHLGKPWISGGILNHSGQVCVYEPAKACYECGLSPTAWQDIRQRMGCADMAQRYASQGQFPTTPIAASIIGAVQVQEAVKMLLDQGPLAGQMWSYEGPALFSQVYDLLPPKPVCDSHFQYPEPRKSALSAMDSLETLFDFVEGELGEEVSLQLDHSLATGIAGRESKQSFDLIMPVNHLTDQVLKPYQAFPGEVMGVPKGKLLTQLDRSFPKLEMKLIDLGIPHLHIVRVVFSGKTKFFELSGDEKYLSRGEPAWPVGIPPQGAEQAIG